MKFKAHINKTCQIDYPKGALALFAVCALASSLLASHAFADELADLRPTWMGNGTRVPANVSLLSSTQDPLFLGPDFQTRILGEKNIDRLKQDYLNQNRDYDMRSTYGLNTTVDEQSHQDNMRGFGKQVIGTARNTQGQQYAKNADAAEKQGDVSQPLVVTGAAASFGMGAPVHLKITDDTKATWSGDLMRQHGQLDVKSPIVTAKFEIDAKTASLDPSAALSPEGTPERYRVSLNKDLGLKFNSAIVYGSTSNSIHAVLSHPIVDHIGASVDTIRPAGDNLSGAPSGETVSVSYGLTF